MSVVDVKRGDDGVWYCRHYIGKHAITGKPIRPYRKFPEARDEAEARAMAVQWLERELKVFADHGVAMRLGDILGVYVDSLEGAGHPANTVTTYRTMIRCYVEPYIGSRNVGEVTPAALDHFYRSLRESGGADGAGLKAGTVITLHHFLSGAYNWMIAQGVVEDNPAAKATRQEMEHHDLISLEEDEVVALCGFLDEAAADPSTEPRKASRREVAMAVRIALATGARCGEVLALRRRDFDPVKRTLWICGTVVETQAGAVRQDKTKAPSSMRIVEIPEETAEAIAAHLQWQDGSGPKAGKKAPICGGAGGFMRPTNVSARFKRWSRKLGLQEGTTFHTLRHTHASLLLDSGEHPKTIQERLGHSKVTTTMEIYTHKLPGRGRSAADTWGRIEGARHEE